MLHLRIHPERPQIRQIRRVCDALRAGQAAVVPTDSCYAFVSLPGATEAQDLIRQIKRLDESHLWSLMCRDLGQASEYACINNAAFRLVKRLLPGPYTLILPASSRLPRRLFGKRHGIGIRIPQDEACRQLLAELDLPLLATTCRFPEEELPATDPQEIVQRLRKLPIVVLDAGWGRAEYTTVIDFCGEEPELRRMGIGPWPLEKTT